LISPRRPQTWASCTTVTLVARGNRCGGNMCEGHGACILWVYREPYPKKRNDKVGDITKSDGARTFVGSRSAPIKPNNVTAGS
jgi:hypothetical protein